MARQADYLNSMTYRKLDENDDYMIGVQGEMLTGLDAIAQALKTRLRTVRGEWFQGDATALPYFNGILGQKNVTKDELDLQVISRLMDTIGVIKVADTKSSIVSRPTPKTVRVYSTHEGFLLNEDRLNDAALEGTNTSYTDYVKRGGPEYNFSCSVQTVYGTTTAEVSA